MSLANGQTTVGTSPTALVAADQNSPVTVKVRNRGTASVFLGGPAVTTATGFELAQTDPTVDVMLDPGEVLYAVAGSGSHRLDVLRFRDTQRAG